MCMHVFSGENFCFPFDESGNFGIKKLKPRGKKKKLHKKKSFFSFMMDGAACP